MGRKKNTSSKRIIYIFSFLFFIVTLLYLGLNSLSDVDKFFDYIEHFGFSIPQRSVKVYFSPRGGAESAILDELKNAKKEIVIAMYYFTSRPLAQGIVNAKDRGVSIKILLDESQLKEKYSKYKYLLSKGVNIRIDRGTGLMHNKFVVIDREVLITGSYNWTRSAEYKNRENLIIIKSRPLAQRYLWEFNKLWTRARP